MTGMPAACNASTVPAADTASGPTKTRSHFSRSAKSTTLLLAQGSTSGKHSPNAAIPALPAAAKSWVTFGLCDKSRAMACSRPPEPRMSTVIRSSIYSGINFIEQVNHHPRVIFVFQFMNTVLYPFQGGAFGPDKRFLKKDGAGVAAPIDADDGYSQFLFARFHAAADGVHTGELGKEGGVEVEDIPIEGGEKRRGKQAHEAGQGNAVDAVGPAMGQYLLFRFLSGPVLVTYQIDGDAEGPGALQDKRLFFVT